LKKITRDTFHTDSVSQKATLLQITNVLFPMYKYFIEPDMRSAMIRINSTYNPMTSLLEPTYVVKAKYSAIKDAFDSHFQKNNPVIKEISDMYLYPPRYEDSPVPDQRNWIRIRRSDNSFFVHFYNEITDSNLNVRPTINFEISVKTMSGFLSLGYQFGAILNRTSEKIYEQNTLQITKEYIKELEECYVQIKGKNRQEVQTLSNKLGLTEHHIPQSFLTLYFIKLGKTKTKENN